MYTIKSQPTHTVPFLTDLMQRLNDSTLPQANKDMLIEELAGKGVVVVSEVQEAYKSLGYFNNVKGCRVETTSNQRKEATNILRKHLGLKWSDLPSINDGQMSHIKRLFEASN